MYDVKSPNADDFINHQEIIDTLAYADMQAKDTAFVSSLLDKCTSRL